MYTSHVERQIEAAHHNGPPGHRCEVNHGHSWTIIVEFIYDDEDLDECGWGPDFGLIKGIIDEYDHQDLNDKLEGPSSAERFARRIFFDLRNVFGFDPQFVQVFEGKGNSVTYTPRNTRD